MALDVSMGGSTNTVLHLLAAAHEAVWNSPWPTSTASRARPCLCKVAPMTDKYHIEDVHRAGGIVGILGELARAGLLDTTLPTIHAPTLADAIAQNDIKCTTIRPCRTVPRRAGRRADAGGVLAVRALRCLDTDRSTGCIRDKATPIRRMAAWPSCTATWRKGCIVKTAGVDESILKFSARRACSKARTRPSRPSWRHRA
jgi:dihydroxy-acid dehydratase